MRIISISLIVATLLFSACTREDPKARQVGREAYEATEQIKQGAKKAAKELRKTGKEIREGWNEARREAKQKK
jgi:hypothetical protein